MEITPRQTCDDLFVIIKYVNRAILSVAEKYDLTPAQLAALYAVAKGHNTMGDVACTMQCDASNVTGIVDRLATQKLISRSESKQDRRTKLLTLTHKGKRVINKVVAKMPRAIGCDRLQMSECQMIHDLALKLVLPQR